MLASLMCRNRSGEGLSTPESQESSRFRLPLEFVGEIRGSFRGYFGVGTVVVAVENFSGVRKAESANSKLFAECITASGEDLVFVVSLSFFSS